MDIQTTSINGLHIIKPSVFQDKRGYFFESYNLQQFDQLGLNTEFVQDNESKSQQNVLRGLHFQNPPHAQAKLVRVIRGAVRDVAVDLRKSSSTYGKHFSNELNEKNKTMLMIPHGFAHGFVTLMDNTIFSYKCSCFYCHEAEETICWNDKTLDINWGILHPVVSEKDQNGIPFNIDFDCR